MAEVAEIPQGYREVPEEDRRKAEVFFERGRSVANTANYEYAIEMYLQGLALDPDAVDAHQTLREISLKRKAAGRKDLGMFDKIRLRRATKDDKQNMLNAEKMLAYDPGNTDYMVAVLQTAYRAGFYDTVLWIGPILQRANADSKSEDFHKYILLRDIYVDLRQWKLAADACHYAAKMRPDDMDLQTELKNLGAQQTMDQGKYGQARSFRDSIRDMDRQTRLLEGDKDIRTLDSLNRAILEAEAEFQADPQEAGKLMKLVEALVRTEQYEQEQRAMDLLEEAYQRTKQFRFRHAKGRIMLTQLARRERSLRAQVQAHSGDDKVRQEYAQFLRDRSQQELDEYTLWSEHYPTDMGFRFQIGVRLFQLERYQDAIPIFQQARQDPKYRVEAGTLLGRCFLEAEYINEATETLKTVIDEYQVRGDVKSKDMYYWYGRALEKQGNAAAALKQFSQVAQWDFSYRDVQGRLNRVRAAL